MLVERYTLVPQKTVTDRPSPDSKAFEHDIPGTGLTADVHVVKDKPNRKPPTLSIATYPCPFDEAELGINGQPYVPCRIVVDAVMVA